MATVRLTAEQCRRDELPPLCARCGRPTSAHVDRTFAWHPPWVGALLLVGILPGVALMFYLMRRMRVKLPMCDRHRGHWANPQRFLWVSVPVCLTLIAVGAMLGRDGGSIAVLGIFSFLGCICVGGIWQSRVIRPERIRDGDIILAGVSEEFAEGAKELRDGSTPDLDYGEYDDEDRPRRRNRYDVDE